MIYERRKNNEVNSRQIYKVADAAAYLRIGVNKCYQIVRSGELKSFKVGKSIRITKTALDNYCSGS